MTVSELIIAIAVGVFIASFTEALLNSTIAYVTNKHLHKKFEEKIRELKEAVLKEAKTSTETGKAEEKI